MVLALHQQSLARGHHKNLTRQHHSSSSISLVLREGKYILRRTCIHTTAGTIEEARENTRGIDTAPNDIYSSISIYPAQKNIYIQQKR